MIITFLVSIEGQTDIQTESAVSRMAINPL